MTENGAHRADDVATFPVARAVAAGLFVVFGAACGYGLTDIPGAGPPLGSCQAVFVGGALREEWKLYCDDFALTIRYLWASEKDAKIWLKQRVPDGASDAPTVDLGDRTIARLERGTAFVSFRSPASGFYHQFLTCDEPSKKLEKCERAVDLLTRQPWTGGPPYGIRSAVDYADRVIDVRGRRFAVPEGCRQFRHVRGGMLICDDISVSWSEDPPQFREKAEAERQRAERHALAERQRQAARPPEDAAREGVDDSAEVRLQRRPIACRVFGERAQCTSSRFAGGATSYEAVLYAPGQPPLTIHCNTDRPLAGWPAICEPLMTLEPGARSGAANSGPQSLPAAEPMSPDGGPVAPGIEHRGADGG